MFSVLVAGLPPSDFEKSFPSSFETEREAVDYTVDFHVSPDGPARVAMLGYRQRNSVWGLTGSRGDFIMVFEVRPNT